jgi:hypothetical protein
VTFTCSAYAGDVFVDGYFRSNGTYVMPHYRSAPDGNVFNNFSTLGNINPYTGAPGTVNPYGGSSFRTYQSPSYVAPLTPSYPTYGSDSCLFCQ